MISIALITYNGEKYIREQMDSILTQTVQDFEFVICDDCSSDSTVSILQEYAKNDDRIKIYQNNKNIGFLKNIEKAITLCNGEYIALSDQDDIWEKEHLQVLYSSIGENFLACGDTLLVDENNNSLNMRFSKMFYGMDAGILKNDEHFLRLLIMENIFQGAAMMLNKKFIEMTLPFPNEIKYHDLWFALCAMALDKFVYVPQIVIRHRSHSENATGKYTKRIRYVKDANLMNKSEIITLLEKLPGISEDNKKTISKSKLFCANKKSILNFYNAISFWFNNYKILYATNSNDRFLIRFLKMFF